MIHEACQNTVSVFMFLVQVMWFSSGGTKSVLHNDDVDNINCLFSGTKDLLFIDYKKYKDVVSKSFHLQIDKHYTISLFGSKRKPNGNPNPDPTILTRYVSLFPYSSKTSGFPVFTGQKLTKLLNTYL